MSLPGPFHPTPRALRVTCRGVDLRGRPAEVTGEGLLARIFQHETDHLDGMLYIDRMLTRSFAGEAELPRLAGLGVEEAKRELGIEVGAEPR